jgi:hypothetical protein
MVEKKIIYLSLDVAIMVILLSMVCQDLEN